MRCKVAPVATHVRPALPVFQWISGFTSTTWVANGRVLSDGCFAYGKIPSSR
jgi:hypothetical protein